MAEVTKEFDTIGVRGWLSKRSQCKVKNSKIFDAEGPVAGSLSTADSNGLERPISPTLV